LISLITEDSTVMHSATYEKPQFNKKI